VGDGRGDLEVWEMGGSSGIEEKGGYLGVEENGRGSEVRETMRLEIFSLACVISRRTKGDI